MFSHTRKKRLGQHFLVDETVANRQIKYANLTSDDIVLEIGPGLGALTTKLVEKCKVIAIERDTKLCEYLRTKIKSSNFELICGDVLRLDLPKFTKIVSNLPYNISSPITFKILRSNFELGILMYQKEFAERLTAEKGSKSYGRLSVNVDYRCICEILEIVPRSAFSPVPKVDSAIVKLVPRKYPPYHVDDEKLFFDVVDVLFKYRRKKIENALKLAFRNLDFKMIPFKDKRVDELTPIQIAMLANKISMSMLAENYSIHDISKRK
jgi:16S rRNA (adenine1518-N6/adenine1519-N6)-dimethyltransferase